MSLFRRSVFGPTPEQMLAERRVLRSGGKISVTTDTAMRHSAVWACLRLRANLISTMPVDVFRKVAGMQVEVPKPPVLVNPGGERVDMLEWMYATQVDLDRGGNAFGLITARDGLGFPSRIDLMPLSESSVRIRNGELWKYQFAGKLYDPRDVWHERQYPVSGFPVGLSPVAHAAWSIGEYLSIQEFALDWFGGKGIPAVHLRNSAKTLTSEQASTVKERYKASVSAGDTFVSGQDWELKPIQAEQAGNSWLDAKKFGIADIARFFDCPGDLIDAEVSTGSITYASITQRNLQLLIMHIGPAIVRRENSLGKLLPAPRFVKLNTDALMRMDPKARAEMFKTQIESRQRVPSETRALDNLMPYTDEQLAEFDRLFPQKSPIPTGADK